MIDKTKIISQNAFNRQYSVKYDPSGLNVDLTNDILNVPAVKRSVSYFPPYFCISNKMNLKILNENGKYSPDHTNNVLNDYHQKDIDIDFKIKSDDELIADERLISSKINKINYEVFSKERTDYSSIATVICFDRLYNILNSTINSSRDYSSTNETADVVIKNFFLDIGINLDTSAFVDQDSWTKFKSEIDEIYFKGSYSADEKVITVLNDILFELLALVYTDKYNKIKFLRYGLYNPAFPTEISVIHDYNVNDFTSIKYEEDTSNVITKLVITNNGNTDIYYTDYYNAYDYHVKKLEYEIKWLANPDYVNEFINLLNINFGNAEHILNIDTDINNLFLDLNDYVTITSSNFELDTTKRYRVFSIDYDIENIKGNIKLREDKEVSTLWLMGWQKNDEGYGHGGDGQVPYTKSDIDNKLHGAEKFGVFSDLAIQNYEYKLF